MNKATEVKYLASMSVGLVVGELDPSRILLPILILIFIYFMRQFLTPCYGYIKLKRSMHISIIICMLMATPCVAPSTRCSSSSASIPSSSDFFPTLQKDYNYLPGVKRWNGVPYHEFITVWWVALVVALGAIVQDGVTLLETAEGNDPNASSTDAGELRRFTARNSRVFACIANYLEPDCRPLTIANAEFPNDGAGLFKWLKVYGDLKVDSETKQGWLNEWNEATMAKVGIPLKPHGIWLWLEWVEDFGKPKKLNATLAQKRKKLLEGFPDSFDNVIAQERIKPDPGSYTIPTNYPAHHPKAGTAHPQRGQADLFALVTALEPEWTRRCKRGYIKPVPRGMVNEVYDDDDYDVNDDYAPSDDDRTEYGNAVTRSKIDQRFVCTWCGGRGHSSEVEGIGQCLTKRLNITIPKEELKATKYPDGITYPNFPPKGRNNARKPHASQAKVKVKEHSAKYTRDRRNNTTSKGNRNRYSSRDSRTPRKKYVRQAQDETDYESGSEEEVKEVNESSDSDGSPVADFAVAFHTIETHCNDYNSSSSDENSKSKLPTSRSVTKKSATTKAKRI
jgi:hypothetical protein